MNATAGDIGAGCVYFSLAVLGCWLVLVAINACNVLTSVYLQ